MLAVGPVRSNIQRTAANLLDGIVVCNGRRTSTALQCYGLRGVMAFAGVGNGRDTMCDGKHERLWLMRGMVEMGSAVHHPGLDLWCTRWLQTHRDIRQ